MLIYAFTELYPSPYKSYFDTQFEELLREGHDLRVFALNRQRGRLESKVTQLGLDRLTSYVPSTMHDAPPFAGALLAAAARRPLRTLSALGLGLSSQGSAKEKVLDVCRGVLMPAARPDLLLVHTLAALRRFRIVKRLYPGVPFAFYYHGGETAGTPEIPAADAKLALDATDFIFTNTENSRAHVIGRGAAPGKVHVIPVGFNLRDFTPTPSRAYRVGGLLRLLSIGRMSREKGFVHAVEAVAQLVASGATFIRYGLVGSGPERAAVESLIAAHQLQPYVTLHGQVSREKLLELLEEADAFILPSIVLGTWQENQACVVQEAMLMRTPVIATATGGVPESLAPDLHEYLVPPEQPAAIAERILALSKLPVDELQALADRGRAFAVAGYDITHVTRKLLEIATR